jgi:hypothetical protein
VTLPIVYGDPECGCEGIGVFLVWNNPEQPHVERCDSCSVFPTDADAAELVQALLTRAALEIASQGRPVLTPGHAMEPEVEVPLQRRWESHADS